MTRSNTSGGNAFVKRSLAALGASALSLGAIVPLSSTAVADAHVQDLQAACEGLTEPFGFKDIQSLHEQTQDAINCLAQYGITEGRSPTTYAPRDAVKRYEMAIFLTRVLAYIDAYDTVGLEITPDWSDAGFEDLEGVPDDGVDAINFIANLGVAKGKTPSLYDPFAPVTRRDMASFINRVQDVIAEEAPEADYDPADATKEFDDVPATMPRAEDIYALEGAGIVQGTSAKTYKPFAFVLRSEMAFYIMRHLNENMAAGRVESQADTGEEPPADSTAPTVTATAPAVGDATVVFTATEDLADGSVTTSDFTTSAGVTVTKVGELNGKITVTLGAGLPAGGSVTLQAGSVADLAGNTGPASAVPATAPAAPPSDTVGPMVTAPATIFAGVNNVVFTADEALDPASVSEADIAFESDASISSVVVAGDEITVTFTRRLAEWDVVTLLAGSVTDASGNAGPAENVTTEVVADPSNPTATAEFGTLAAGTGSTTTLTFSENISNARLDPDDFSIGGVALKSTDITIGGSTTLQDGREVVELTFPRTLEAEQVIVLRAGATYDDGGNRAPAQDATVTVEAATVQQ